MIELASRPNVVRLVKPDNAEMSVIELLYIEIGKIELPSWSSLKLVKLDKGERSVIVQ